jgi:hypothetical protein
MRGPEILAAEGQIRAIKASVVTTAKACRELAAKLQYSRQKYVSTDPKLRKSPYLQFRNLAANLASASPSNLALQFE